MKNNINKKISTTLLAAAIMAGTAVIPMSNAAVEEKINEVPTVRYQAHVQDRDWMDWVNAGETAGTYYESRRVEALRIQLVNCPGVTLNVKEHIQDYGDREFTVTSENAEQVIGTQWEARRVEAITITSTGLKELGYKLEYRVHGQEYGWEQGWKQEGEMAGTMYQALRLEAIEIRVVPIETDITSKAEAISRLDSYDAALKAKYTTANSMATYDTIHTVIEDAKKEINNAITSEKVAEEFESVVAEIKRYEVNIEEEAITNALETEAKKVDARADIAAYETATSNTSGLTQNDKNIIDQILKSASEAVEASVIPQEVTIAVNNLDALMSGYSKVAVLKEQTQAIEELNKYLPNSTVGVQNVVSEAIADINKATIPSAVTIKLTSTKGILDDLVVAQRDALNELSVYKDVVNASTLPNKQILINAINAVETNVKNAKVDTEINTNIMPAFRTNYTSFEEAVKTRLFEQAIDNAIAELTPYLSYTDDVKYSDGKAPDATVTPAVTPDTVAEYAEKWINDFKTMKQDGYLADVRDASVVNGLLGKKSEEKDIPNDVAATEYLKKLDYMKYATKQQEKLDRELYQSAYTVVMDALNKYTETVKTLEITDKQKEDINSMIEKTKIKIASVSDAQSVLDAAELLDEYMSTYCGAESSSEVKAKLLEQAKNNAITILEEYRKSNISSVVTAANGYISNIKTGSFADYKAVNEIVEKYKYMLDIGTAKFQATEKLVVYGAKTDSITVAGTVTTVGEYANDVINAINSADNSLNVNTSSIADMQTVLNKIKGDSDVALTNIKRALNITAAGEAEEIKNARTDAYKVVNKYVALATELGNNQLVNNLNDFNTLIANTNTVSAIRNIVNDSNTDKQGNVNAYIKEYYTTFAKQYEAINSEANLTDTDVKSLAYYLSDEAGYKTNADFSKIEAIVANATDAIKHLERKDASKGDDTDEAYIVRMLREAANKVAEFDAKVVALNNYKEEMILKIMNVDVAGAVITDTPTPQENVYIERIKVISLDACTIIPVPDTTPVQYQVTKSDVIANIMKEAGEAFGVEFKDNEFDFTSVKATAIDEVENYRKGETGYYTDVENEVVDTTIENAIQIANNAIEAANNTTTIADAVKTAKDTIDIAIAVNLATTQLTATMDGENNYIQSARVNETIQEDLDAIKAISSVDEISDDFKIDVLNKVKADLIEQIYEYASSSKNRGEFLNKSQAKLAVKSEVENISWGDITAETRTDDLVDIAIKTKAKIELALSKANAKSEIASYGNDRTGYYTDAPANSTIAPAIVSVIETANSEIDAATDKAAVDTAVTKAKGDIDVVVPAVGA